VFFVTASGHAADEKRPAPDKSAAKWVSLDRYVYYKQTATNPNPSAAK
jgi:hypothetical protein